MRNFLFILLLSYIYLFNHNIYSQPIPYGTSIDSAYMKGTYRGPLELDSKLEIYYYKPANYDSVNSPILWYICGSGGATGAESNYLQGMANKRKALIVAPTPPDNNSGTPWAGTLDYINDTMTCGFTFQQNYIWLPHVFKQIYRHVLARTNRDSIPVYFTGFSAGAQCVTRYMLVRQYFPDSIPIKMAVSMSPCGYIFGTDIFNDSIMHFAFGLARGEGELEWDCKAQSFDTIDLHFLCNEHVAQYYNENYGVMVGTLDTGACGWWPLTNEGYSRYERAKNFYNFSDTNAITRGTTLKWIYDTVPGVGHSGNLLADAIAPGDSIPILERMLFETPWHPVPHSALVIDFSSNTRVVTLPNATVQFYNNSINALNYLWDFGDGSTSTSVNPSHTYAAADTFTVKLMASSGSSCTDTLTKKYFIIVNSTTRVNELQISDLGFEVYPNPSSGVFAIESKENKYEAIISNVLGEKIYSSTINANKSEIDLSNQPNGIYFLQLKTEQGTANKKIIIQR